MIWIEKTQIQFCKQVLGVNKQCPNVACRNELGRLPLKEITNVNIFKFWIHLENKQGDIMPSNVYKYQTIWLRKIGWVCEKSEYPMQ